MGLRIAGTGHRPNKLGGYSDEAFNKLVEIAEYNLNRIGLAKDIHVISGMALGWDMALAQAAVNLELPLICAVPFLGQEAVWPQKSKDKYNELLAKASEVVIVSDGGYSNEKMQIRNAWMVDNCDLIFAMHDGTIGGTNNCVKYAEKVGKRLINLYSQFNRTEIHKIIKDNNNE